MAGTSSARPQRVQRPPVVLTSVSSGALATLAAGSTIVAIAGEDFCVVAADTRQSNGYAINTRYAPKAFKLYGARQATGRAGARRARMAHIARDQRKRQGYAHCVQPHRTDRAVIASSGFYGDIVQLNKRLKIRIEVRCAAGPPRPATGTVAAWTDSVSSPRVARRGLRPQYAHQHNKQISTPALAQMLSNTLYYKRFFPYYAFNIVGGIDEQGPPLVCRACGRFFGTAPR